MPGKAEHKSEGEAPENKARKGADSKATKEREQRQVERAADAARPG